MTQLYVSDTQVVVAHNGASALFQPGVPRPLRAALVGPALSSGVRLFGADAQPEPAADEHVPLSSVVEAIRELMAAGDPKSFGVTGEPKLAALRKKLGPSVTDALRDEAWAQVKAEV